MDGLEVGAPATRPQKSKLRKLIGTFNQVGDVWDLAVSSHDLQFARALEHYGLTPPVWMTEMSKAWREREGGAITY